MNVTRSVRQLGAFLCGVVLTGSVLAAPVVDAATYYVATTGQDANPGTATAPFRTVNKGVKGLKPGDTLYIKSGTYAEALNNTIPGGTSWSAPVTVAAYPGHTVTLRPPAGTGVILYLWGSTKQYIVVDGLSLDGTNINGNGISLTYPGTDTTQAAHHIRIKNTEVKHTAGSGVYVGAGSNDNALSNLRVHHTGWTQGHGLYIKGHRNVVEHSRIYENQKCGIQFYRADGPVNHNIFRYNQVYHNGRSSTTNCQTGLWIGPGTGMLAYNNLLWGNPNFGIAVGAGASNAQVYNNTSYGNGPFGLYLYPGSTKALIKNNIVYGNSNSKQIYKGESSAILANNLTSNPLFVAPAQANFKLQAASPAIDAGVKLSQVPNDYAGVSRPKGASYDIGAYEYTGTTSSALVAAPMNLRIREAN